MKTISKLANIVISYYKSHKLLSNIFIVGIVLFSILIIITDRIKGSDDIVFQSQIMPYQTMFDWVSFRYQNWSGRIFPELFVYIFSPAPIFLWKIMSVIMYALMALIIFAYYKLLSKQSNTKKDAIVLGLALSVPFLINTDVLRFGMFWVTGSMNYFWIATLGLIGFYPIIYYVVYRRLAPTAITIIGLVLSVIAAMSQEQIGAIMTGLAILVLIHESIKGLGKLKPYLIINTFLITSAFLVGVLAPGNALRVKAETSTWLPDFYTTPILNHLDYSYRWFLDATINHMGILLVISWSIMALVLSYKKHKTKLQNAIMYFFIFLSIIVIAKSYEPIGYWFNYYATWKPDLPNKVSYLVFVPWLIAITTTIISPLVLFGKKSINWLMSALYLSVFASTALITLSPTMYASGWRTLFIPSLILCLIICLQIGEMLENTKINKRLILTAVAIMAIFGYIYMALRLIHNIIS